MITHGVKGIPQFRDVTSSCSRPVGSGEQCRHVLLGRGRAHPRDSVPQDSRSQSHGNHSYDENIPSSDSPVKRPNSEHFQCLR